MSGRLSVELCLLVSPCEAAAFAEVLRPMPPDGAPPRYVSTPFSLDVGEVAHIKQTTKLLPPAGTLGLITKYSIEILRQVCIDARKRHL